MKPIRWLRRKLRAGASGRRPIRGFGIPPDHLSTRISHGRAARATRSFLPYPLVRMLLTGRNLAKWYGPRLLFSGITIGFEEGERVGLIGANGSGKSTLLRIFAGLEQPDEGELITRRQLRVGYVPPEDAFDPIPAH